MYKDRIVEKVVEVEVEKVVTKYIEVPFEKIVTQEVMAPVGVRRTLLRMCIGLFTKIKRGNRIFPLCLMVEGPIRGQSHAEVKIRITNLFI